MKCRYFCRLPLDISPVYLTRGISQAAQSSESLCRLRPAGAKLRIWVPAGCRAIHDVQSKIDRTDRFGIGQPALLSTGKPLQKQSRACGSAPGFWSGWNLVCLVRGEGNHKIPGSFAPENMEKTGAERVKYSLACQHEDAISIKFVSYAQKCPTVLCTFAVALRKESVDRNFVVLKGREKPCRRSPQGERG